MKIQTKIQLIVVAWLIVAMLSAGLIVKLNSDITKENQKVNAANDLINDIFQLNILTNEYLVRQENRSIQQWYSKYDEITNAVESSSFDFLEDDRDSRDDFLRNVIALENTYSQLVESYTDLEIDDVNINFRARLTGQLSRNSQEIISDALLFSNNIQVNIKTLEGTITNSTLVLIVIFSSFAIVGGYFMLRSVAKPVIELAKAKAKDDAILKSMNDGLIVVNKKGKINRINSACESILGLESNAVVNKLFSSVIPIYKKEKGEFITIDKAQTIVSKSLKAEKEFEYNMKDDIYVKTKSEKYIPVSMAISPIILKDQLIGGVLIFGDISEEKAIDEAKTEFVSLASHQLQTPLTAANWSLQILQNETGISKKEKDELMKQVYDSNERMKELVRGLLNVSRMELSSFMVTPVSTQIEEIIESLLKELEANIKKNNVEIIKNFDKSLPAIMLDQKLIRIVMQNILSNAVKYSSKGNVEISITRLKQGDLVNDKNMKNDCLIVKIKDSGLGIPEEEQSKIFDKMYRASNAKEKVNEGTGLGLYLAKSIIDTTTEGEIWFTSKEGVGTEFFVTIPLSGMAEKEGSRTLD